MNRQIGALVRHGSYHLKVGITNWPERRWREHRPYGWDRMYVVYRSSSWKKVCALEQMTEQKLRNLHLRMECECWNERAGGAGRIPENGPFFVYILTESR